MARPMKYTKERAQAIIDALRAGNTRTASVAYASIAYTTFLRWLEANESFANDVKKAEADAEVRNVAIIQTAAKTTWTAAAWWLERRKHQEWRQRKDLNVKDLPTEEIIRLLEADASAGSDEAGDTPPVEIGAADSEGERVLEVSD